MATGKFNGYISCFSNCCKQTPDKKGGRVLFWLKVCRDTVYDRGEDIVAEGSVMTGVYSGAPHLLMSWWNVNIL